MRKRMNVTMVKFTIFFVSLKRSSGPVSHHSISACGMKTNTGRRGHWRNPTWLERNNAIKSPKLQCDRLHISCSMWLYSSITRICYLDNWGCEENGLCSKLYMWYLYLPLIQLPSSHFHFSQSHSSIDNNMLSCLRAAMSIIEAGHYRDHPASRREWTSDWASVFSEARSHNISKQFVKN